MHRTTGRWQLGLALTLGAVAMWATLPIALKALLGTMDAYTITWYRFLVATMVLGAWLAARRGLPRLRELTSRSWVLLAAAILGLAGNYLLYLLGLSRVSPGTAQMVIQLAPMFLLLGGLVVFGERFRAVQWAGFALLLLGLALFFNDRLADLLAGGGYGLGVFLVVAAAVLWAVYALAQKQLLGVFPSETIMWCIYLSAVVLFLPMARLDSVVSLSPLHVGLLAFGCINTLVAYGCFAEALAHWEASRVSAVLAVTPLLTLLCMELVTALYPDFIEPERLNLLSAAGALMVVVGSALTALGGARPAPTIAVSAAALEAELKTREQSSAPSHAQR